MRLAHRNVGCERGGHCCNGDVMNPVRSDEGFPLCPQHKEKKVQSIKSRPSSSTLLVRCHISFACDSLTTGKRFPLSQNNSQMPTYLTQEIIIHRLRAIRCQSIIPTSSSHSNLSSTVKSHAKALSLSFLISLLFLLQPFSIGRILVALTHGMSEQ